MDYGTTIPGTGAGALAYTGVALGNWVLIGAAAIVAGAALVIRFRFRRSTAAQAATPTREVNE